MIENNNSLQESEFNSETFASETFASETLTNSDPKLFNLQNESYQTDHSLMNELPVINMKNVMSALNASMNINNLNSSTNYDSPIDITQYHNRIMHGGNKSSDTSTSFTNESSYTDNTLETSESSLSELINDNTSDEFSLNQLLGGANSQTDTDDIINLSSILNGIDSSISST